MIFACSLSRVSFLKVFALLLAVLAVQPFVIFSEASARYYSQHRRHHDNHRSERPAKRQTIEAPQGPLFAVVSISRQRVYIYSDSGLLTSAPISTGQPGHPTPTGMFTILAKERFHRSNLYSGAPMPFMQRVTWSGVAMHQGILPGYPASHGCIRMPLDFARNLFGMTKVGQRVVITRQDIEPFEFASVHLPVPKMQPMLVAGEKPAASSGTEGPVHTESLAVPVKAEVPGTKLLNPIELANLMRKEIAAKSEAAAKVLKAARAAAGSKESHANEAVAAQKRADAAMAKAAARVAALKHRIEHGRRQSVIENAKEELPDAEDDLHEATGKALAAYERRALVENDDAIRALRNAEQTSADLLAALKEWKRRTEPVSIFISRKSGRLAVRQNFNRVFDVPVTIRNADQPLGTHLFIATAAEAGGAKLRWQALSIPDATPDTDIYMRRSGIRRMREEAQSLPPSVPLPSATQALDRIEIPRDVSDRIAEMVWTGATLIISDHGVSNETGEFTDFIISTR
jgi:hypothetical protein